MGEYAVGLLDLESGAVAVVSLGNILTYAISSAMPLPQGLYPSIPHSIKIRCPTGTAVPTAYHYPITTELFPLHQLSQQYFHTLHHAAPPKIPFPRLNCPTPPVPPYPAPLTQPFLTTTTNLSSPCWAWYSPLSPT